MDQMTEIDDFYTFGVRRATARSAIRRLLVGVLPEPTLRQLQFELNMLIVRARSWNASRAFRGKTGLLVNIGAGDVGKQTGWVNMDGSRARGVNCLYDARKRLPFPDKSVRGIFTEHFFEHIDYTEEAPHFLAECHRVLQDDGVIRIIVPDAEKYLEAYVAGGWNQLAALRPLDAHLKDQHFQFKYNTRMELINVVFRQAQEHKFAYDFETLELLLKRNGFQDIQKQEYGKSVAPEICIDLQVRASESLYVEAVKRSG
jgi:predicted SAM-dependent methyltransferase